jgi:hypothetical protein
MVVVAKSAIAAPVTVAAQTAQWLHHRDGSFCMQVCIDTNSIQRTSDGLTHYDTKICSDEGPHAVMSYAVDCSQDFSKPFLVRFYYRNGTWKDFSEQPSSGYFPDATYACQRKVL